MPFLVFDPRDEINRFLTGVSDDLQEECYSSTIYENMNISHVMVMINKWKMQGLRERIDIPRGKGLLMVVCQRVGLIFNTSLCLKRDFPTKILPSSLRLGMTGCLTLSLKL